MYHKPMGELNCWIHLRSQPPQVSEVIFNCFIVPKQKWVAARVTFTADKSTEPKDHKKLLDTIRLPLVSVFPRKKENAQNTSEGPTAGLASTETLNDPKNDEKKGEELKNVSLDVRCVFFCSW